MSLADWKEKLNGYELSPNMDIAIDSLTLNPKRPLGKLNPWAWWVEITRGCNLSCDFCPTRLFPKDEKMGSERHFMDIDTWSALLYLIQEVSPRSRLELCNAGEPTLHPKFIDFIKLARVICPELQILTYTNGTQFTNGRLKLKDLFDAGLNMVFWDMYSSLDICEKIAKDSGYTYFHQDDKPKDAINIFQYQGDPECHTVMLCENPYNWSKAKLGRGYLQTFFNDLDWTAAKKFGMIPVDIPPNRRCDLPNKFINVNYDGTYIFCCFDYLRHSVGEFGTVHGGLASFFDFWLGEYMQNVRTNLYKKERFNHEYCKLCRFTSIRCDIPYWKPDMYEQYWDGQNWVKLESCPVIPNISKKSKKSVITPYNWEESLQ